MCTNNVQWHINIKSKPILLGQMLDCEWLRYHYIDIMLAN